MRTAHVLKNFATSWDSRHAPRVDALSARGAAGEFDLQIQKRKPFLISHFANFELTVVLVFPKTTRQGLSDPVKIIEGDSNGRR